MEAIIAQPICSYVLMSKKRKDLLSYLFFCQN